MFAVSFLSGTTIQSSVDASLSLHLSPFRLCTLRMFQVLCSDGSSSLAAVHPSLNISHCISQGIPAVNLSCAQHTHSDRGARRKWVHRDNDKWRRWLRPSRRLSQHPCPPSIQEGVLEERQDVSAGCVSAPRMM